MLKSYLGPWACVAQLIKELMFQTKLSSGENQIQDINLGKFSLLYTFTHM